MDPATLRYTQEHEWVHLEGTLATVGITDHAQEELGDIVFLELPQVGARVEAGKPFGTVESVKAVWELFSPITGEVQQVNGDLKDSPESVNRDPYGKGWMIKVSLTAPAPQDQLLTAKQYEEYVQQETAG